MDTRHDGLLNPWLSIWTQPRDTIQHIVDENPERLVWTLAALGGFAQALVRSSSNQTGDEVAWFILILISAVAGSIIGIVFLYITAIMVRWTGRWLGGQGSIKNIRAAIAWANVPSVWTLVLWIPGLLLFRQELFTTETPRIDASASLALAFLAFSMILMTAGVWSIFILLKCVGQVQGFSAWKALGNLVLATVPYVILLNIFIFLTRVSSG
jgi:hypothetical protein